MRGGQPVPVIDVPMLALGRRAHALRSTRLVMVRYRADEAGGECTIGLIVERATQTMRIDRAAFRSSGISTARTRWLGRREYARWRRAAGIGIRPVDDVARLYLFDGLPGHGESPHERVRIAISRLAAARDRHRPRFARQRFPDPRADGTRARAAGGRRAPAVGGAAARHAGRARRLLAAAQCVGRRAACADRAVRRARAGSSATARPSRRSRGSRRSGSPRCPAG